MTALRLSAPTPLDGATAFFQHRSGDRGTRNMRSTITVDGSATQRADGPGRLQPINRVDLIDVDRIDGSRIHSRGLWDYRYQSGVFDGSVLRRWPITLDDRVVERPPLTISKSVIRPFFDMRRMFAAPGAAIRQSWHSFYRPNHPVYWACGWVAVDGRVSRLSPHVAGRIPSSPRVPSGDDIPDTDAARAPKQLANDPVPFSWDLDGPVAAPTLAWDNDGAQAVITLPNEPVPDGAVGLVLFGAYELPMDNASYVDVETAETLDPDDVYILDTPFGNSIRPEHLHPRQHKLFEVPFLSPHGSSTRFAHETANGASYEWATSEDGDVLRINVAPRARYSFYLMIHWTSRQEYYRVLRAGDSFRLRARLRVASGAPSAIVSWEGIGGNEAGLGDRVNEEDDITPGDANWAEVDITRHKTGVELMGHPDRPSDVGPFCAFQLIIEGGDTGGSIDLHNIHIEPPEGIVSFSEDQLRSLRAANPRLIRYHMVKERSFGLSLGEAFAGEVGLGRWKRNSYPGAFKQILDLIDAGVDTSFWLQPPWYWSNSDIDAFWEYMCTPYDDTVDTPESKPWAYRRHAHGFADTIQNLITGEKVCEPGNELWQGGAAPEFYGLVDVHKTLSSGQLAGIMLKRYHDRATANSHFRRKEWTFYGGGFFAGGGAYPGGFDGDYLTTAGDVVDSFGGAVYNSGWDVGSELLLPDERGRFATLTPVLRNQAGRTFGELFEADIKGFEALEKATGRAAPRLDFYEAGPGYQVSRQYSHGFAAQNRLMKGRLSGTSFLHQCLFFCSQGLNSTNFFAFGYGRLFTSHNPLSIGGRPSGAWLWFEWFNQWCVGDVKRMDARQVADVFGPESASENAERVSGGPEFDAYRIVAEGHVTYVALNLSHLSDKAVQIQKPTSISGPATRWTMPGERDAHSSGLGPENDLTLRAEAMPEGYGLGIISENVPSASAVGWVFKTT